MIDISETRLVPFQAFHDFHEKINIHIKVAHSAAVALVRETGMPAEKDKLADLIVASHPSWTAPPVRDLTIQFQKSQDSGISSFAIVAIFSAFDDFMSGVEAEISRCVGDVKKKDSKKHDCKCENKEEENDEEVDRIFRIYTKTLGMRHL